MLLLMSTPDRVTHVSVTTVAPGGGGVYRFESQWEADGELGGDQPLATLFVLGS
jgi:hypothetical protein